MYNMQPRVDRACASTYVRTAAVWNSDQCFCESERLKCPLYFPSLTFLRVLSNGLGQKKKRELVSRGNFRLNWWLPIHYEQYEDEIELDGVGGKIWMAVGNRGWLFTVQWRNVRDEEDLHGRKKKPSTCATCHLLETLGTLNKGESNWAEINIFEWIIGRVNAGLASPLPDWIECNLLGRLKKTTFIMKLPLVFHILIVTFRASITTAGRSLTKFQTRRFSLYFAIG